MRVATTIAHRRLLLSIPRKVRRQSGSVLVGSAVGGEAANESLAAARSYRNAGFEKARGGVVAEVPYQNTQALDYMN
jgi:hypothetical protein